MLRMDKNCERCGRVFRAPYRDRPARFCSLACYHASGVPRGRQPATVAEQRMRIARGHPLAPPSGMVAVSRLVLYEKIGAGTHPCNWCDTPVKWMPGAGLAEGALLADHLDWDRNNDDPENLVPSCNRCNAHRTRQGDRKRITQDELTVLWSGVRTRAIERQCERCGEMFLIPPSATGRGRGRFCSRSCARSKPPIGTPEGGLDPAFVENLKEEKT